MIVTMPCGEILMNELGTATAGAGWAGCPSADGLKYKPSSTPPPASELTCKNARRLIGNVMMTSSYGTHGLACRSAKKLFRAGRLT